MRRLVFVMTATALSIPGLAVPAAQAPAAAAFTAAQAAAGRAIYAERCAACHLDDLGGNGDAPPVAGTDFVAGWKQKTTGDLLKYLRGMPPGGPALGDAAYVDVMAYLLEQNGAAAGDAPLTAATDVAVGAIATGRRPAR